MVKRKRLLDRFLRLVRISSLSLHEKAVVKYIKNEVKAKVKVEVKEDGAGKRIGGEIGNLWIRIKGKIRSAPKLLLNAHLDTVSPGKGIKPRVRKGYVLSDGSTILGADNKAGVSVILEIIKCLKEDKIPHGDITVLFTVAEEIGLLGAKNLPKKKLDADFGFTLDGGDIHEIINQAPSQDNINVEIFGRAAHAGVHPEKGISAIKVASHAISRMRLGRIDSETTANIGVIKGGVATNIIPERIELKGEARSHDPKKLKNQIRHMKGILSEACRKYKAGLKIRVTPAYRSFKIGKNVPLLKLAARSAKAAKIRAEVKKTGGGSDANIFNALGIPTLIIGAGADRVHTTRERVAVDDMIRSAEFLLEIIKEVSRVKK